MNDAVAVRAYGFKICDRIDCLLLFGSGQRLFVMYVDEAFSDLAVALLEVEAAHVALWPVVLYALPPSDSAPLVRIDFDFWSCPDKVDIRTL